MAKKRNRWVDGVIVLAAVVVGALGSQRIWVAYAEQKSDTVGNRSELRALELKNEDLMRERARAESRWGRDEIARRNGHMGTNEIPIDSLK